MPIKDLVLDERPREKLLLRGPEALSQAELLAILIGSGTPGESAVALMQKIMKDCGGRLAQLERMSFAELKRYHGIGPAKAVTLMAFGELARRRAIEEQPKALRMDSPEVIYRHVWPSMRNLRVEECRVLYLNQNLRLIKEECLSHGGISETSVDVRVILRHALLEGAVALVLCHNHPSGSPRPGAADDRLTEQLARAAKTMNIRFVDHLVAAADGYYSYANEGKL